MGQLLHYYQKYSELSNKTESVFIDAYKDYLNLFDNEFRTTGRLNIPYVINGFFEYCKCYLWPELKETLYGPILENTNFIMYPLTNNTGFFGYNSYIHASTNNVILLGIPYSPIGYDNFKKNSSFACPALFYNHDIGHSHQMDLLKDIREQVLLSNYSRKDKEIMIFFLWYETHENYQSLNFLMTQMQIHINYFSKNDFGIKPSKSALQVITKDIYLSNINKSYQIYSDKIVFEYDDIIMHKYYHLSIIW
jgi:hypothetical protein